MTDPLDFTSSRRVKVAAAWAVTLLWAGTIYWFSGPSFGGSITAWLLALGLKLLHLQLSPAAFDFLHFSIRKLAHLTEYAILAVLIYFSLESPSPHAWRGRKAVWAIVLAGLYSLTDEYHQSFVPGRGPSLRDCGLDTVGATLGILATYLDARKGQARSKISTAPSASTEETKNGVAGE